MNVQSHFRSIADELWALKNRVRNFIEDAHWQTDGEWKESVLRNVLSRHMPVSIGVGRGFVIAPSSCSSQIDIIIYDSSKPTLYKDGDLVFVTADAVKAVIEVKSRIVSNNLTTAMRKLADNAEFVKTHRLENEDNDLFVGLFAYDFDENSLSVRAILRRLHNNANGQLNRIINHVTLGKNLFIRFWHTQPSGNLLQEANPYNRWHSYGLDDLSPGYFISNATEYASDNSSIRLNRFVWYPPQGKEQNLNQSMQL